MNNEPEVVLDLDKLELTNEIASMHKEGNYLVGVTAKGVEFRQHIPGNKVLVKKGDAFALEDVVVG